MTTRHQKQIEAPPNSSEESVARLFDQLSQRRASKFCLSFENSPPVFCHLIAALGLRQAAISQH
jgi:nitrate reductase cytochrome c-type subunit